MEVTWKESEGEAVAEAGDIRLRISQYGEQDGGMQGRWFWIARCLGNLDIEVSGIVNTREQAMQAASEWMVKGVGTIRQAKIEEILLDIDKLLQTLRNLDEDGLINVAGWNSGYRAGLAAAGRAIENISIDNN